MKKQGYYTTGEFAEKAHVTLRTIRWYDSKNLLKPSALRRSSICRFAFSICPGYQLMVFLFSLISIHSFLMHI